MNEKTTNVPVKHESVNHKWNSEFCSCGSDCCTCQGCGRRVCGSLAQWFDEPGVYRPKGNIGFCCFGKFGLGHAGTEVTEVAK